MDSDFSVLAMKIRILTAPNERYCEVFTWQGKKTKQKKAQMRYCLLFMSWDLLVL